MNDDEELVLELDDDALSEPKDVDDSLVDDRRQRRIDGPQQKGRPEFDLGQRLADDPASQRLDVDGDIWKLWHVLSADLYSGLLYNMSGLRAFRVRSGTARGS